MSEARAQALDHALTTLDVTDRLLLVRREVDGPLILTTSFGLEDQVLTHVIAETRLDVELATLDTGRLFPQTYELWAETEERYGLRINPFAPHHRKLEELIALRGINGFYQSIAARKECCFVRKVEPLARALDGASAWVTGLRGDQSAHRGALRFVAWDAEKLLFKINPLLDWTRDDAVAFAREHSVPINPLHAKGFLSIGCAPCTRPVEPGETERAGRWWWEEDAKKECGLHIGSDGRVVRRGDKLNAVAEVAS